MSMTSHGNQKGKREGKKKGGILISYFYSTSKKKRGENAAITAGERRKRGKEKGESYLELKSSFWSQPEGDPPFR